MGKSKKNFHGKEAFHRINFLHQASRLLINEPSLSTYYGYQMTGIAKKVVIRIDPDMKRTICKGCYNHLIPGISAQVKLIKKKKLLRIKCTLCYTIKRFNIQNTNYKFWYEKMEETKS